MRKKEELKDDGYFNVQLQEEANSVRAVEDIMDAPFLRNELIAGPEESKRKRFNLRLREVVKHPRPAIEDGVPISIDGNRTDFTSSIVKSEKYYDNSDAKTGQYDFYSLIYDDTIEDSFRAAEVFDPLDLASIEREEAGGPSEERVFKSIKKKIKTT
jgi:hypothetical protein